MIFNINSTRGHTGSLLVVTIGAMELGQISFSVGTSVFKRHTLILRLVLLSFIPPCPPCAAKQNDSQRAAMSITLNVIVVIALCGIHDRPTHAGTLAADTSIRLSKINRPTTKQQIYANLIVK